MNMQMNSSHTREFFRASVIVPSGADRRAQALEAMTRVRDVRLAFDIDDAAVRAFDAAFSCADPMASSRAELPPDAATLVAQLGDSIRDFGDEDSAACVYNLAGLLSGLTVPVRGGKAA